MDKNLAKKKVVQEKCVKELENFNVELQADLKAIDQSKLQMKKKLDKVLAEKHQEKMSLIEGQIQTFEKLIKKVSKSDLQEMTTDPGLDFD